MKYILLLGLLFCIKHKAFGVTRCLSGTKMGAAPGTEVECAVTDKCSLISGTVSVMGTSMDIQVGQCILAASCSFVKCSAIQSQLSALMPSIGGGSMEFENCRAQCCKDGECETLTEDGGPPIVPYGPIVPVADRCQVPLWNMPLMDNWNGISRSEESPAPKFKLIIKKLDKKGGYLPNKMYKYIIKPMKYKRVKPVKINGYFITLESNSSACGCKEAGAEMCPVGRLITSRVRKAGVPVVQPGCDEPAVAEMPSGGFIKAGKGTWQAPDCTDAEIIMRVHVRGSDGRLYQDNDEVSEKFLTKVITPSQGKKGKKPKKPKRPKRPRRE